MQEVDCGSDPNDSMSVCPANLLLYYPFDIKNGTVVANGGTLATDGTLFGTDDGDGFYGPSSTNDYGLALRCNRNGSNDVYVGTTFNNAQLGFQGTNGTFMAWVRWDGGPVGGGGQEDHMIFGNPDAGSASIHYGIRNNGGTNVTHFGTWAGDLNDAGVVPIGVWTHMTFVHDGVTGRVYIDGVETTAGGYGINGTIAAKEVWIGAHTRDGLFSFNGFIDEVKVFDRALLPSEIAAEMAAPTQDDSDSDGLPDWWEVCFGLDPNTARR